MVLSRVFFLVGVWRWARACCQRLKRGRFLTKESCWWRREDLRKPEGETSRRLGRLIRRRASQAEREKVRKRLRVAKLMEVR